MASEREREREYEHEHEPVDLDDGLTSTSKKELVARPEPEPEPEEPETPSIDLLFVLHEGVPEVTRATHEEIQHAMNRSVDARVGKLPFPKDTAFGYPIPVEAARVQPWSVVSAPWVEVERKFTEMDLLHFVKYVDDRKDFLLYAGRAPRSLSWQTHVESFVQALPIFIACTPRLSTLFHVDLVKFMCAMLPQRNTSLVQRLYPQEARELLLRVRRALEDAAHHLRLERHTVSVALDAMPTLRPDLTEEEVRGVHRREACMLATLTVCVAVLDALHMQCRVLSAGLDVQFRGMREYADEVAAYHMRPGSYLAYGLRALVQLAMSANAKIEEDLADMPKPEVVVEQVAQAASRPKKRARPPPPCLW